LGIIPEMFITNSNWRAILATLLEATVPEENPEMRDAETRVDAVIAAQNILCKLNAKCSASPGRGEEHVMSISDLRDAAGMCLEAFLKGVEDYSVDKRGDVGSWVREASMRAFSEVLRCFETISKCSDDTAAGGVVAEYEKKCTTIVGVLLKQCGEKIDRTRTVAFESLFALLRGTAGRDEGDDDDPALVSNAKEFESIRACVPRDAKDVSSEAGLQRVFSNCLTKAVRVEPYTDYALSGWVASAGAVTESLSKAASTALLAVLSGENDEKNNWLKEKVAMHLITTFDAYSKIDRVTVPAIRCVDVLFTGGAFDSFSLDVVAPDEVSKDYKTALSDKIRFECAGTRDVSKYILAANALSHMASCTDSVEAKKSARLGLLAMMRNKFPRVRQIASEVLHMALSSEDDVDENTEEAMGMLTARFWEATMNPEMKEAIHAIYAKLDLEIPKQSTAAKKDALKTITEENLIPDMLASSKAPAALAKKIGGTADENSSYQSLVEFSGR